MLFNSLEYLFFLPIVFCLYWSLRNRLQAQNLFVLICSYFFYGLWDYRFLSLIVFSSLVDYSVGRALESSKASRVRLGLLLISLFVNLGLLFFFKYFNFFIEGFVDLMNLLNLQANYHTLKIVLPVGISFYTFQTLSYTIDVYRGKIEARKNPLTFFTYVAFFPQLVAGPIERASNLLPQFERKKTFNYDEGVLAMRQILWGFFKKVVIADNCAIYVNEVFGNSGDFGSPILILAAVLYAFQIYGDFSGYSDIAIGSAKLLGVNLMQNFATPYFARDIAEFWRRWHISLSSWFRDYLYIPLGGSRVGKWLKIRNVFIIFIVSGFWHGANWTFIIWGFLHALFYLPQLLTKTNRSNLNVVAEDRWLPNLKELVQMIVTFGIVCFAWIFFRAENVTHAYQFIQRMSTKWDVSKDLLKSVGKDASDLNMLIFFLLFLLFVEWINRAREFGLYIVPKIAVLRYLMYLGIALAIIQFFYGESEFIYFQF